MLDKSKQQRAKKEIGRALGYMTTTVRKLTREELAEVKRQHKDVTPEQLEGLVSVTVDTDIRSLDIKQAEQLANGVMAIQEELKDQLTVLRGREIERVRSEKEAENA